MAKATTNYLFREMPLWLIALLTAWLPENLLTCRIRGLLSRPFFKSCGARFSYGARVRFIHPENLVIGDSVYVAQDGWINAKGGVVLEDGVTIGPRCGIVTTFHRFIEGKVQHGIGGGGKAKSIHIGEGTWLGMNVVVTHGTVIGKGCTVAANAVVTKDTPDGVVVGGVPASVIADLCEVRPVPRADTNQSADDDELAETTESAEGS